jgi:hypothetical protein
MVYSTHKMFVDILKFDVSSVDVVHKMRRMELHTFLQWFRSERYKVYVLEANIYKLFIHKF